MKKRFALFSLPVFLLFAALITSSCTCGFDCSRDGSSGPVTMTLSFYAVLPEELKEVVVTVESLTFRRDGSDDVIVETFTNKETDGDDAESFQTDLTDYAAETALTVITDLVLDSDFYTLEIAIITDDISSSFVKKESGDAMLGLKLSGTSLTLPGIEILGGEQKYVVVFHLAQALSFNANSDTYTLESDGVRLQNESTSADLSGIVDSQLFDTDPLCGEKSEPTQGNRIYLYAGDNLNKANLADAFTSSASGSVAIAPFAIASLVEPARSTGDWEYFFSYLPSGSYTLAFACNAEEDDPSEVDDILIPQPDLQTKAFTLLRTATKQCDLELEVAPMCDF